VNVADLIAAAKARVVDVESSDLKQITSI